MNAAASLYRADPHRQDRPGTGVHVRARLPDGKWDSVDIAHLDRESLEHWLRSRDSIELPINVVLLLLGHPR